MERFDDGEESLQAASKVFNLPELLEQILLNLDMMTLFRVQRVNKTSHSIIKTSQYLRREMFLLQDTTTELKDSMDIEVNPILFHPRLALKDSTILLEEPQCKTKASLEVRISAIRGREEHPLESFIHNTRTDSWRNTFLFKTPCSVYGRALIWPPGMDRKPLFADFEAVPKVSDSQVTLGRVADMVNVANKPIHMREANYLSGLHDIGGRARTLQYTRR